jgi:hypothetical protein
MRGNQIQYSGLVVSDERRIVAAAAEIAALATTLSLHSSLAVPSMVANAGNRAAKRFLEFFAASIENDNTRMAYYRAVCNFFAWLEQHGIGELVDIEPFHVAAYLKALKSKRGEPRGKHPDKDEEPVAADPTKKQHLAAIRMLFDWLIVGQVLAISTNTSPRPGSAIGRRPPSSGRPPAERTYSRIARCIASTPIR